MALNRNTLIRLTTLDRCLSNRYRRWTMQDLMDACSDALYEYEGRNNTISRRTIQSDLQLLRSDKLGYNAPIEIYDKKYYRYSDPDFSINNIGFTDEDISTIHGAMDILRHFSVFPQMASASDVFAKLEAKVNHNIEKKPQAIHLEKNEQYKGLELIGPLCEAIKQRKVLAITYQSFKAIHADVFQVSPFVLKEYHNRWFLIASGKEQNKIRILAIDRILDFKTVKGQAYDDCNFDAETFFSDVIGVTKSPEDRSREIHLLFDSFFAPYISTKPLHPSQETIGKRSDGWTEFKINVVINPELIRELLGYGSHLEVLYPPKLRDQIKNDLKAALNRY